MLSPYVMHLLFFRLALNRSGKDDFPPSLKLRRTGKFFFDGKFFLLFPDFLKLQRVSVGCLNIHFPTIHFLQILPRL